MKLKGTTKNPIFIIGLGGLAALGFNNWLLGPWLNQYLFSHNGSVSELSALTQPHHNVFRLLDVLSGVLFVVLARLLSKLPASTSRWRQTMLYGLIILGLANILDAGLPLKCSETLDRGCTIPVSLSPSHLQLPSHAYSSVTIAVCYFVLPLAGFFFAFARKFRFLGILSTLAILVALFSFISAVTGYLSQHSLSVRTSGAGQEIQMLVIGAWLVAWCWSASRPSS